MSNGSRSRAEKEEEEYSKEVSSGSSLLFVLSFFLQLPSVRIISQRSSNKKARLPFFYCCIFMRRFSTVQVDIRHAPAGIFLYKYQKSLSLSFCVIYVSNKGFQRARRLLVTAKKRRGTTASSSPLGATLKQTGAKNSVNKRISLFMQVLIETKKKRREIFPKFCIKDYCRYVK